MSHLAGKGHAALRRGRFSNPGATYFLKLCTSNKKFGLHTGDVAERIWAEVERMGDDHVWQFRCGVIMPDHVHLLVDLADALTLERCIQRLKAKTSRMLSQAGLIWERGFFDHRLRENDAQLPVFLYIYLNPYRAKLLAPEEAWPEYRCVPEDWLWFGKETASGLPFPSWLET